MAHGKSEHDVDGLMALLNKYHAKQTDYVIQMDGLFQSSCFLSIEMIVIRLHTHTHKQNVSLVTALLF